MDRDPGSPPKKDKLEKADNSPAAVDPS